MERRRRFNHFPEMVPLSPERLEMRTRRFAHSTRLRNIQTRMKTLQWMGGRDDVQKKKKKSTSYTTHSNDGESLS